MEFPPFVHLYHSTTSNAIIIAHTITNAPTTFQVSSSRGAESIDLDNRMVILIFAERGAKPSGTAMGLFRRKVPSHLVRVHPDNVRSKDWLILLEAGTIIGPSPERLRVAKSTLDRKIVKKYNMLLHAEHFLDIEGYDPRIHAVFFCPQLYKYDSDKKLVPLQGDEIGRLIAHALERGIAERQPWYEPSEKLPDRPVVDTQLETEFDALVVDMPARNHAAKGSKDAGNGGANAKR